MRRATVVALLLLAACSFIEAQDRALISGDAQDKQDAPVSGVQVTLSNDSLGITRTATTNADGYYFFAEVIPAEGYVMKASAPGMTFAPSAVRFDVEVGETRHVLPSFIGEKPVAPTAYLRWFGLADAISDTPTIGALCGSDMARAVIRPHDLDSSTPLSFMRQAHPVSGQGLFRSLAATKPIETGDFRRRQLASENVFPAVPGEGECFGSV